MTWRPAAICHPNHIQAVPKREDGTRLPPFSRLKIKEWRIPAMNFTLKQDGKFEPATTATVELAEIDGASAATTPPGSSGRRHRRQREAGNPRREDFVSHTRAGCLPPATAPAQGRLPPLHSPAGRPPPAYFHRRPRGRWFRPPPRKRPGYRRGIRFPQPASEPISRCQETEYTVSKQCCRLWKYKIPDRHRRLHIL